MNIATTFAFFAVSVLQITSACPLPEFYGLSADEQNAQGTAPALTLSAGLRSMTLGCNIQVYFLNAEMSAILGVGSIPQRAAYSGWSKPVFTAALRKYFGELNSRPFIDLSFSAVATSTSKGPDYGPAVQVGYCFLTDFGLTLNVGIGGGYAIRNQIFGPTLILDLGFTFR
jgi:hypothetical protein